MEYVEGVPEYKFHSADTEDKDLETKDKSLKEKDFDELYDEYFRLAYGLAYERLNDFHAVEDVLQEVFLRFSKELDNHLFGSDTHVKAWLLRITANLCTDVLRRRQLEEQYILQKQMEAKNTELIETMDKMIEDMDAQARIDKVFRKLKRKRFKWYKVAVDMYCNQKSNAELAEKFGMSYAAMGMLLNRIRRWIGWELFKQNPELRELYPKEYEELKTENQKRKSVKKKKYR